MNPKIIGYLIANPAACKPCAAPDFNSPDFKTAQEILDKFCSMQGGPEALALITAKAMTLGLKVIHHHRPADFRPRRATADVWYDFLGQTVFLLYPSGRLERQRVRSDAMAHYVWRLHGTRRALVVVS